MRLVLWFQEEMAGREWVLVASQVEVELHRPNRSCWAGLPGTAATRQGIRVAVVLQIEVAADSSSSGSGPSSHRIRLDLVNSAMTGRNYYIVNMAGYFYYRANYYC